MQNRSAAKSVVDYLKHISLETYARRHVRHGSRTEMINTKNRDEIG